MSKHPFINYKFDKKPFEAILEDVNNFRDLLFSRRSVRHFSDKPVSKEVIESILQAGASSPSGANKQPWSFCAISDPELKEKIRTAAEDEEYKNYHGRMSEQWLKDLEPLGTDCKKDFITTAPWIIVIFKKPYDIVDGNKYKNYYVNESVGIAAGMLITAIHFAGLVTLTHTPSPMNFLEKILERPKNERSYLLLPVGYPAKDAMVPDIHRKEKKDVLYFY